MSRELAELCERLDGMEARQQQLSVLVRSIESAISQPSVEKQGRLDMPDVPDYPDVPPITAISWPEDTAAVAVTGSYEDWIELDLEQSAARYVADPAVEHPHDPRYRYIRSNARVEGIFVVLRAG